MLRIYLDTSIFGGVFDSEFEKPSKEFIRLVNLGIYSIVISDVVQRELKNAPPEVRELHEKLVSIADLVVTDRESLQLRDEYIQACVVTEKWRDDALHVALATVNACDLIVSWNFRHIVHFQKIHAYNEVNAKNGYDKIGIHSPLEVMGYEAEEEI
ncbi:MAG: type II toxin-antitoxin system VapC family toxin [Candidatus Omnitrophica bacterium]|nr:type II toxin-antitoxin system VapC family toxin [Candidatus Omnitrophota bacterium]MCB9783852.1 type II toxin-antitoxin system VapC family toxin [Candidatus Omnitrophota bacterium]